MAGVDGDAGALGAGAKVCRVCGVDLQGRPRVKDAEGHYYCASYAETRACSRGDDRVVEETVTATATDAGAGAVLGSDARAADDDLAPIALEPSDDDDIIPVAGGGSASGAAGIGLAPEPVGSASKSCPVCARSMLGGSATCAACGFRWDAGIKSSNLLKKTAGPGGMTVLCSSCGYDMGSGASLRCTECGSKAAVQTSASRRKAIADDVARDAYLRPLITVGACLLVMIVGQFLTGGIEGLIGYAVLYGATMVLGYVLYNSLCLFWLGFDAPQHLVILRLGALYAGADLAFFVSGFIPIPLLPWIFALMTYVSLTMYFLELEMNEALVMIAATFAAKVIAVVIVYSLLMG